MIFNAINSLITAGKQNKLASKIHPVNTEYTAAEPIRKLYSEGQNLYRGRMVGANAAEQNIMTNAANTNAQVQRNAGDASTALAVAAGVGGQTNDALADLATRESQDKQNRFGVYSNVSRLMADEGQKVYEDKLRRYYDDLNYKRGLEGAAMQNKASFWSGLDDTVKAGISAFSPGGILGGVLGGGNKGGGGGVVVPQLGGVSRGSVGSFNLPAFNQPQPYTNRNVQIG